MQALQFLQKRRVTLIVFCAMAAWAASANVLAAGDFGKVELIRDRWHTPHVFADSDRGAMYGLGYATAEDRGFQMHYTLRIIQGRLCEVVGIVKKTRRDETSLDSDRKMRTFGFYRAAKEVAAGLDEETSQLLAAYCDGVNEYFRRHKDELPEVFEQTGLKVEPWTPADCLVSWWHLAQFFATDGTRDLMHYRNLTQGPPPGRPSGRGQPATRPGTRPSVRPGAPPRARPTPRRGRFPLELLGRSDLEQLPPDESTSVVQREDVTDAWLARTYTFLRQHGYDVEDPATSAAGGASDAPKFSHAWVVDGKRTGTGSATLVSMPQTPVANPSLFYEFHVRGHSFDARGIGVAGSPGILIGWNRNVAWGLTALGADQADLFRLKTDADHPDQYEFDGEWRPMQRTEEKIHVKNGRTQTLVVRQTHFGPVINEFAFARADDPPVALKRIPICEPGRDTIQGALAMLRAKDVHEFRRALEAWRFPTANVVFGDRQGSIGYSTIGALALRSPLALAEGGAAHDGSTSRLDWRAIVPQDLVPQVINPKQGYLFSGNHRPVGSFYPIPLGIRTGSMGDTVRSWRLRELLGSAESLSPDVVLRMHNDAVNPARREIVRVGLHLRDVLKRELPDDARRALAHIEPWYAAGAASRLDVPGAEVAMELNTFFRMMATDLALIYGGGESGLTYFLKTIGRRLDNDPKADVEPLEQQFIERALADAWQSALRKYRDDPAKWNEHARRQVTLRKLGFYESLDGFPSLNAEHDLPMPSLPCVDGGTIQSQAAEAYTQWVPLDDVDRARSILPPGNGERPGSPQQAVNTGAWVRGELHPAPLSRAAVERIAESREEL